MNISLCVESLFTVIVKECDDIYNLGCNEWFEFVAIWQWLHVLEDKSYRRYSLSREDNFLLKSDNSAMKIFYLFSVIECQGGQVRLNITIHPFKIRGAQIDSTINNCLSWDLMIMSAYNLVGFRCNGRFYRGVISNSQQQWVSKVLFDLTIKPF